MTFTLKILESTKILNQNIDNPLNTPADEFYLSEKFLLRKIWVNIDVINTWVMALRYSV